MRLFVKRLLFVNMVFLLFAAAAVAQDYQRGLNNEAYQVQQGLNTGVLNPNQATQLDGQINQIQQQSQMDRAMNGGQLTQQQRQQLGSEVRGVGQNMQASAAQNGFNGQVMNPNGPFSGHHHHRFNNSVLPYNQNGYQSQSYPNQAYPNQAYPNQFYNNGQYAQYPSQYQQYPPNSQFGNANQQGGLSGAASLLRNLFH